MHDLALHVSSESKPSCVIAMFANIMAAAHKSSSISRRTVLRPRHGREGQGFACSEDRTSTIGDKEGGLCDDWMPRGCGSVECAQRFDVDDSAVVDVSGADHCPPPHRLQTRYVARR